MSSDNTAYHERLWPSPWIVAVLVLLGLPAVTLTMMPLNQAIAIPVAIVVIGGIIAALLGTSPRIEVTDGMLRAGSAEIPISALGKTRTLNGDALRDVLGIEADARAYLLIRGFVHSGVQVEVADPIDPTPYWVITTRHPDSLVSALVTMRDH